MTIIIIKIKTDKDKSFQVQLAHFGIISILRIRNQSMNGWLTLLARFIHANMIGLLRHQLDSIY